MPECCQKRSVASPDGVGPAGRGPSVAQRIALALLWAYKTGVSPLLASGCKFHPTCSQYAREAIEIHGVRCGCWLALKRLLKCRPFAPGGIDPVPESTGPADA